MDGYLSYRPVGVAGLRRPLGAQCNCSYFSTRYAGYVVGRAACGDFVEMQRRYVNEYRDAHGRFQGDLRIVC